MKAMLYLATIPLIIAATLTFVYKTFKIAKQCDVQICNIIFPNKRPLVMAHRGGQDEAPENTLLAIENAYRNGATGIEIDVDFTLDGVAVLHHDDTVDRTTNGTGNLKDMTYAQAKQLNAATEVDFVIRKDKGKENVDFEPIPLLHDALEMAVKYKLSVNLDVKRNASGVSLFLKEFLERHPTAHHHVFVTSFDPFIVYKVRSELPQISTGLIWRSNYFARTAEGNPYAQQSALKTLIMDVYDFAYKLSLLTWLPDFLGVSLVSLSKFHLFDENNMRMWKNSGFNPMVWTVNKPDEKMFFLQNDIPVITDTLLNM